MTGRRIAPARLRDVPGLARVLWSFDAPWLPRVRSRARDLWILAVLVRRGQIRMIRDSIGPAAFIARDGEIVHALYVHSRARRRGLGRALMEDAKQREPLLRVWTALENGRARHFYAGLGFAAAAFSDGQWNDESLPEVQMVWPHHNASGREAARR